MNKNNNVIQAKNILMQEYAAEGELRELRLKKGMVILTSNDKAHLRMLSDEFEPITSFDITELEKGLTNSFHITINNDKNNSRSNIFLVSSEEEYLQEQFERMMKSKKIARCGIKKVVSIIINNNVKYKALAEEMQ